MKSSLKTLILWIFVILLSVSLFIYFGDTSSSFTPGVRILGTVNGSPIINKRVSDFTDNLRSLQNIYQSQGLDVSQYQQALVSEAFRRAVVNHLSREEANKVKISVSDADVLESIKKDYFQNNEEDFQSFIQTGEASIQRDIEELVRGRLVKEYYEDVIRSISFSQKQLKERIEISSKQRRALVGVLNLTTEVEKRITPEVLQAYYQNNISRYISGDTNRTFLDEIENVRSDYILENRENLITTIQNSVAFMFQNLRSNQAPPSTFRDLAMENNMVVLESGLFNFFSRTLNEEQNQGKPIINDRATIQSLFFIPVGRVSNIISNLEDFLLIVYIIDEVEDKEVSNFVKQRYTQELNEEVTSQILTAFYSTLYNQAEIEVNQATPESQ